MPELIASWWPVILVLGGLLAGGVKLLLTLTQLREARLQIRVLEQRLEEDGKMVVLPTPEETQRVGRRTWSRVAGLLLLTLFLGTAFLMVMVPQFNTTSSEHEEAALASALATIRRAAEMYKIQHMDHYPDERVVEQLTTKTTVAGEPGDELGPYLRRSFPQNPIDKLDVVHIVSRMPDAPTGAGGWLYSSETGEFRANTEGKGSSGTDYFDL